MSRDKNCADRPAHLGKSAQEVLFSTLVNQQQPQSADENAGKLFDADVLPVDQKADHQQREGETHTRCQRTVTHLPTGAVQKHLIVRRFVPRYTRVNT